MNTQLLNHKEFQKFLLQFKFFLKQHFLSLPCSFFKGHKQLKQSIEYSMFSECKYFRPLLVFATAQLLSIKTSLILPWAASIEIMHVASLIHDDLPSMDNSLTRRGKASNHRRFTKDISLLAGDCLWIEAFRVLSLYGQKKNINIWLPLLCEAGGFNGLMGGQALDLKPPINPNKSYYKTMHSMKTGALISATIKGVLKIKPLKNTAPLQQAAELIGQAFQLCDDLQDTQDTANFVTLLGKKEAQKQLYLLSDKALKLISDTYNPSSTYLLESLIVFNRDRSH